MNTTNEIIFAKTLSQVKFLIFMLSVYAFPSVAMDARTQQTVAEDLALLASFNSLTDVIENRGEDDFVTIGTDGACDFNSALMGIQDVVETGAVEIRVASNGLYQENLDIFNRDIVIRGGFATCADADLNNQVFSQLVTVDGSSESLPVLEVRGLEPKLIRLENILLSGGDSNLHGGGILVQQFGVELQLLRVRLENNNATLGGGIAVITGAHVYGQDVLILNNSAVTGGGGAYCSGGDSKITLAGMSLIGNNDSLSGGGVQLSSCNMSMYSSLHNEALISVSGIVANESTHEGGGGYLRYSSELNLFGQKICDENNCLGSSGTPIFFSSNQSGTIVDSSEPGGGLYMVHMLDPPSVNKTRFYANGVVLEHNRASGDGGGIYLEEDTEVIIERLSGGCWHKERCNLIINNKSGTNVGFGGAFYLNGGKLNISQSYVEENRADLGTAIYATGESAQVTIEGSVFDDNGDEGSGDYSDFHVVGASLGASISVRHSTFAQNDAVNSVFDIGPAGNSSLNLLSSIVYDGSSGGVLGGVSGPLSIDCVLVHEDNSFSGNNIVVANPLFFNGPGGDFHLSPGSPAIDMCHGIPMFNSRDIDNESRGWNDPNTDNGPGFFDAGADESYTSDVIFKHDFEAIGVM